MGYLIQDIETIPESELAGSWEPTAEEIKKANGDPFPPIWAHKVINIGMLVLDENLLPVNCGCAAQGLVGGKGERAMVERWSNIGRGEYQHYTDVEPKTGGPLTLVDYNGRGFDMPVLQYRAFRYGITLDWYMGRIPDNRGMMSSFSKTYRDRYSGKHLDMAELWTNHGAFTRPPLKHLAKLIGLPGKTGIDGSQTYQAWKDKRFKELDQYVMEDVYQTAFIFFRYKMMSGEIDLSKYQSACEALLSMIETRHDDDGSFVAKIDRKQLLLVND